MSRAIRSAVMRWNVMTDRPTTSGSTSSTSRATVDATEDVARMRSAIATLWCESTLPASDARAPFGMRIATAGMCSNASGIESSRMFMVLRLRASDSPRDDKLAGHAVAGSLAMRCDGLEVLGLRVFARLRVEARIGQRDGAAV